MGLLLLSRTGRRRRNSPSPNIRWRKAIGRLTARVAEHSDVRQGRGRSWRNIPMFGRVAGDSGRTFQCSAGLTEWAGYTCALPHSAFATQGQSRSGPSGLRLKFSDEISGCTIIWTANSTETPSPGYSTSSHSGPLGSECSSSITSRSTLACESWTSDAPQVFLYSSWHIPSVLPPRSRASTSGTRPSSGPGETRHLRAHQRRDPPRRCCQSVLS